ncbi:MAG: precorrin-6A/cobalt-precorrin-6A reductase, partial [Bacillota bacterium]|nr:precorrin-6A/cobalt-precorrin-6A reductase [Bacillota bacterium]
KNNNGNVLLTIGSKNLKKFADEIDNNRLYLRILPFPKLIQEALDMGIELKKIIGIQGPFSKEVNKVLIKSYEIKYIVTKNSGVEGGIIEKIEAAEEMEIKSLILDKPKINYPNKYDSIKKLITCIK